jgi:plastocyanin
VTSDARKAVELAIERSISRRGFLRRAGQAALGVAALPILAACAPSDGGAGATRTPGSGGALVEMTDDLRFEPEELTVNVGDTVTWRNTGSIVHTSTDDPSKAQDPANAVLPEGAEPWDSGDVAGGEEFSHTFDTPGDYTYFCIPHETAGMVARLTVTES